MAFEREWEIMIQKCARTYLRDLVSIVPCTVDSVDEANRVCDCTPIGGDAPTQIPSVQLCAENDDGFVVFPTIGSTVIVALSTRNNAYVWMYSQLDSIQMLDGTYDGLVKVKDLVDRLNKIENWINQFIPIFNAMTLPVSGSTAGPPSVPITNVLIPTTQVDIENPLITHGK